MLFVPHQLWWDRFDRGLGRVGLGQHPLEFCILLLGGGWVVVRIDQFGQLSYDWPCSNVFCLK